MENAWKAFQNHVSYALSHINEIEGHIRRCPLLVDTVAKVAADLPDEQKWAIIESEGLDF
jgi:hypothetical protein